MASEFNKYRHQTSTEIHTLKVLCFEWHPIFLFCVICALTNEMKHRILFNFQETLVQNGIHIVAPVARIPSPAFQIPRQTAPPIVHNGQHQGAAPSIPYHINPQMHHQQGTGQLSNSVLSQGTTGQSVSGLTPISSQVELYILF